jgi:HSP20 family protein
MAQEPRRTGETTPTNRESGNPMMDLRRQVDQLFDDFAGTFGLPAFGFGFPTAAQPRSAVADVRVEVSETPEGYDIAAEVPGMSEDDIDIDLNNDVLTIKGEKKAESEDTGKNYHVAERTYGRFQRSFRLPDTVDRDNIDASFDKGLLKVHMPKRTEAKAQTRKINVKSA